MKLSEGGEFDLIILGAGISAGPLIEYLAPLHPNSRILILDKGCHPDDTKVRHPDRPIRIIGSTGRSVLTKKWWSSEQFGGASNLWYGQLSRFEKQDFEERVYYANNDEVTVSTAWPIQFRDLVHHYEAAESILRPYTANQSLGARVNENSYVTKRSQVGQFEESVFSILQDADMEPYSGQTCLGGRAWSLSPVDPITMKRMETSSPSLHDRNWTYRTMENIKEFPNLFVAYQFKVKTVEPSKHGFTVIGRSQNGVATRYFGRLVVLSCGVLSSFEILSDSGLCKMQTLGTQFTFSTEVSGYITTSIPRNESTDLNSIIGSFANISSKKLVAPTPGLLERGGKLSFYDALYFEGFDYHRLKISKLVGARHISKVAPTKFITIKFSFKGDSVPWEYKKLLRSPSGETEILYSPHPHDYRLVSYIKSYVSELASNFPNGRILGFSDNVDGDDKASGHLHGGVCFGNSSDTSLLSSDCMMWEHPGLYILDGSYMPSSGTSNSSLTLMANSLRIANIISKQL